MFFSFNMDEEEKEDIDIFTEERLESLTAVIGIRCKEGIVLATGSQRPIARCIDMKRHGVKTIIPIKKILDSYSVIQI
jgi:20S proteasome alpha/beta subunit